MDGPGGTALPVGMRVVLDRRARRIDGGAALLGGAPMRLLHLSAPARALLADEGTVTVRDARSAALARTLLDAGIAHPADVPSGAVPPASDVTVVVPVKDRTDGLTRLLAALPDAPHVVVVDDGSADPAAIRAAAGDARVLRHPVSRGPAAARNAGLAVATTPLVAFLDSDVVPEPGWLAPLLACFADPAVGLAAPRIVALASDAGPPIAGALARYEAVHSSLDLGPDPALVVPRSRVAYVPSAALLVRRAAVGAGFDEGMHVAEDVDLVLRAHGAGWRLRYAPDARVAHDHRTTLRAWWLRKAYYGTGAAPLAARHVHAVPPMVLTPTSAAVAALVLWARPVSVVGALAVAGVGVERMSRRLRVRRPRVTAARLVGIGALGATGQTADAVLRHYWPVALAAALVSRRARRTVAAVALAEGAWDWWEHRDRDARVRPRPVPHVLAHRLDDLAYGAGLWWGAWRARSVAALRPGTPSDRVGPKG